jgi:hypothetical protein
MPQSPWVVLTKLALATGAIVLFGACATPYQARSFSGGYQEREAGPNRWYVEFFGNGHTTRDTVSAYWLYRCAELTRQKGFDYFVVVAKKPEAGARLEDLDIEFRRAAGESGDGREILRARGGGTSYVPMYAPGGTVTTWSSRGVIELHKGDAESDERPAFVAKEILEKLGPPVQAAMQSGENIVLPRNLFVREERAPQRATGGVKLEDLDALLPKTGQ